MGVTSGCQITSHYDKPGETPSKLAEQAGLGAVSGALKNDHRFHYEDQLPGDLLESEWLLDWGGDEGEWSVLPARGAPGLRLSGTPACDNGDSALPLLFLPTSLPLCFRCFFPECPLCLI